LSAKLNLQCLELKIKRISIAKEIFEHKYIEMGVYWDDRSIDENIIFFKEFLDVLHSVTMT
jgi:hypothetical protein